MKKAFTLIQPAYKKDSELPLRVPSRLNFLYLPKTSQVYPIRNNLIFTRKHPVSKILSSFRDGNKPVKAAKQLTKNRPAMMVEPVRLLMIGVKSPNHGNMGRGID